MSELYNKVARTLVLKKTLKWLDGEWTLFLTHNGPFLILFEVFIYPFSYLFWTILNLSIVSGPLFNCNSGPILSPFQTHFKKPSNLQKKKHSKNWTFSVTLLGARVNFMRCALCFRKGLLQIFKDCQIEFPHKSLAHMRIDASSHEKFAKNFARTLY